MNDLITCDCGFIIDNLCECHNDNLCDDCHKIEHEEDKE